MQILLAGEATPPERRGLRSMLRTVDAPVVTVPATPNQHACIETSAKAWYVGYAQAEADGRSCMKRDCLANRRMPEQRKAT